eukprot:217523-Rhodomonas_salina.1
MEPSLLLFPSPLLLPLLPLLTSRSQSKGLCLYQRPRFCVRALPSLSHAEISENADCHGRA